MYEQPSKYRSEEDLLLALQRKEPEALEYLYDSCSKQAFGLAYRILGDSGAAEDTVQESFIAIWQQAERLERSRGHLVSLLLTIVHHKAIDLLRQRRGQPLLFASFDSVRLQEYSVNIAETVVQELGHRAIQEALTSLPEQQRRTVELAYFDGYTQAEIAAIMNVPLGTVKSRMRTALERLRALLQDKVKP